ncbi:MAG: hypothetical protein IPG53_04905 [Ignavibacteriales bacterium]|nr:hypothetical protein [Ignavibacteriales bacterium]
MNRTMCPDEAERIKSENQERGSFKVIDKVTVKLNEKDLYEGFFQNLSLKMLRWLRVCKKYERSLAGGIWCIITLKYFLILNQMSPHSSFQTRNRFRCRKADPKNFPQNGVASQKMSGLRHCFEVWVQPDTLDENVRWHFIGRMIPFVENNYNMLEPVQEERANRISMTKHSPN